MMASLIVIALVSVVAGVLVGAFIAVSIAIRRGNRVRSLIWRVPDRPVRDRRPLTGSGSRL
jgi:hypothetical protein